MTVGRQTQEFIEILESIDSKGRQTQQFVEVLESIDAKGRQTQQFIEVLYSTHMFSFSAFFVSSRALLTADLSLTADDKFSVSINPSVNLSANFIPTFQADVTANVVIGANLTGRFNFTTVINASTNIEVNLQERTLFTASISASGLVVVDLRENIEYLSSSINVSSVIVALMDVPWHPGNTLDLTQSITVDTILEQSASNVIVLTQSVNVQHSIRSVISESTLNLTQLAEQFIILPTQVASNSLFFTQNTDHARQGTSFLILTQNVLGIISFLDEIASNTLVLTDLAEFDGTVFTRSLESILNLIQVADFDLTVNPTASNTINFIQNVVGTKLSDKTFMIFQAPFEFIQTSIVVPSPLLDDTENLISNIKLNRNMEGEAYTYIKTSKSRLLKYTFILDRLKGLEFEAFLDAYNGSNIKMQNWKGEIWKVKVITNPIDFVQTGRYEPGSDRTDVNLEFEGIKISG